MASELKVGDRVLALVQGDITQIPADAIVNAANESLVGGGGVDGAIHRAGGPEIMNDLQARYGRRRKCETGSSVVSVAGNLPARWVIHAVGPRWRGGRFNEPDLLWSAFRSSLHYADELGARTVTFPAISTGIYGYPVEQAAPIALEALRGGLESARSVEKATIVIYSPDALEVFERKLSELAGSDLGDKSA
ncbi:MAG TPA: macro domain-containing protein [Actinomycetota bacterium]|nr:macro domain-containing protein [Actinomycetota bacterium]